MFDGLVIFVFPHHVGVMKENERVIRSDGLVYKTVGCQINLVGVVDEAVGSNKPTRS